MQIHLFGIKEYPDEALRNILTDLLDSLSTIQIFDQSGFGEL